jgi:hypothetical protein
MFNRRKNTVPFENALTDKAQIHYSRYIVSWIKMILRYRKDLLAQTRAIELIFGDEFEDWLRSEGLSEDEISDIRWIATNGKLELESSAASFIKSL